MPACSCSRRCLHRKRGRIWWQCWAMNRIRSFPSITRWRAIPVWLWPWVSSIASPGHGRSTARILRRVNRWWCCHWCLRIKAHVKGGSYIVELYVLTLNYLYVNVIQTKNVLWWGKSLVQNKNVQNDRSSSWILSNVVVGLFILLLLRTKLCLGSNLSFNQSNTRHNIIIL